MGNVLELCFELNDSPVKTLEQYNSDWKAYNPRKVNYGRKGLSLTSIDGGLSGVPDLDSLREYNLTNNTQLNESSFKIRTPVVESIASIRKIFDYFGSHISRSHFIKFDRGGFFPPHRDGYASSQESYFRLFALVSYASPCQYHFVIDNKLQFFLPQKVYYINTMLEHSFVSFTDSLIILVINVDQNVDSIRLLENAMVVK